jgi:hypothetical protein
VRGSLTRSSFKSARSSTFAPRLRFRREPRSYCTTSISGVMMSHRSGTLGIARRPARTARERRPDRSESGRARQGPPRGSAARLGHACSDRPLRERHPSGDHAAAPPLSAQCPPGTQRAIAVPNEPCSCSRAVLAGITARSPFARGKQGPAVHGCASASRSTTVRTGPPDRGVRNLARRRFTNQR